MKHLLRVVLLIGCLIETSACGGGGSSTSTAPTPTTVQLAGVWNFSERLASATGGECFASLFQAQVGTTGSGTLQITQSGAAISIRYTDNASGGSCDYSGTAGASSAAFNTSSCTSSDVFGATCPGSTARRDLRLVTGGYNASSASSTSMSGTGAET